MKRDRSCSRHGRNMRFKKLTAKRLTVWWIHRLLIARNSWNNNGSKRNSSISVARLMRRNIRKSGWITRMRRSFAAFAMRRWLPAVPGFPRRFLTKTKKLRCKSILKVRFFIITNKKLISNNLPLIPDHYIFFHFFNFSLDFFKLM